MKPHNYHPQYMHENGSERLPVALRRENVLVGAEYAAQNAKRTMQLEGQMPVYETPAVPVPVSAEVIEQAAKAENLAAEYPELDNAMNAVEEAFKQQAVSAEEDSNDQETV